MCTLLSVYRPFHTALACFNVMRLVNGQGQKQRLKKVSGMGGFKLTKVQDMILATYY